MKFVGTLDQESGNTNTFNMESDMMRATQVIVQKAVCESGKSTLERKRNQHHAGHKASYSEYVSI